MIRKLVIAAILMMAAPSSVFAFSASYCSEVQKRVDGEISSIKSANASLMSEDKIENLDKMISNANTASQLADEMKAACDMADAFGDYYSWCYGYFKIYASESAEIKLKVADYCLKKRLTDTAKKLYREIITTYTGDAYRSYVKQAEFGLDDVRTLEKRMEQEKEEKEKADREAAERAAKEKEEQAAKKTSTIKRKQ